MFIWASLIRSVLDHVPVPSLPLYETGVSNSFLGKLCAFFSFDDGICVTPFFNLMQPGRESLKKSVQTGKTSSNGRGFHVDDWLPSFREGDTRAFLSAACSQGVGNVAVEEQERGSIEKENMTPVLASA